VDPDVVPVYEGEERALEAELARGDAGDPGVIVLFCHAERDAVVALLERRGASQVDVAEGLREFAPQSVDGAGRG